MDALSEILRDARLTGGVFMSGTFSEPWCLAANVTAGDCSPYLGATDHLVLFHYVVEGMMTVQLADGTRHVFAPEQAAIFPHNDDHTLSGCEPVEHLEIFDESSLPAPGALMEIKIGGGGAQTRIICGFLGGRLLASDPLFSVLPPMLRFDCASERSGSLIKMSFELAADELTKARPGTDAVLARLSELLFVESVRSYVEDDIGSSEGLVAALRDRSLSKAVALIHRTPDHPWSVNDLARHAAISKSGLADRFRQHLSCSPMEYLTQHRMRLAARALETTDLPLLEIAASVGYGSEAALSRAFKRFAGVSPSVWRERHTGAPTHV